MNQGLTGQWIDFVLEAAALQSLNSIWIYSKFEHQDFSEHREAFFWILEKAIESGQLRLKKNGEYLVGTPKDLAQKFREVLPNSDRPYPAHPHLNLSDWFFDPMCPGEAVWRAEHPDGRVEWMHCP